MGRDIKNGQWHTLTTKAQHDALKCGRVRIGTWEGPGRYMLLTYQQRCPRGCCYDDVTEVVPAEEVVSNIREEMQELASLLKDAKGVK